jgi:predicted nucleotide-binding protein
MNDTLNPYNSTKPGNLFTGYGKMRDQIRGGLRNGRSYAVIGGRRCGKTSLLLQLERDLSEKGMPDFRVVPCYFDIQGEIPASVSDFFRSVSRLIVKGTGIAPWEGTSESQAYQAFLKYLEQAMPRMEKAYGTNWLVILLIDELDVAAGRLRSDECFHNLRNFLMTSHFAVRFRIVVSGVRGLTDLVKSGSPLNHLEPQYLARLDKKDARELIAAGFGQSPDFSTEARLLELTGGHPYLLQGVLEYLWEDRDAVTDAAVFAAVRRFVRNWGGNFVDWLRGLGQSACAGYDALAGAPNGELPLEKLRQRLPRGASADQVILSLSYHGLIDDSDPDRVCLRGTIFRDWHLQNRDLVAWGTGGGGTAVASAPQSPPTAGSQSSKHVFVVYGRDRRLYSEVCLFLRALKIEPLEWNRIVEATGKGAPTIMEILEKGFSMARAAVVLLTPDDEGRLREHFLQADDPSYERELTAQPRPNVIFEAGLAMAKFPESTILVRFGNIRPFSDIGGIHLLDLNNEPRTREHFSRRLESCGCEVDRNDPYWQTAGDLQATNPAPLRASK